MVNAVQVDVCARSRLAICLFNRVDDTKPYRPVPNQTKPEQRIPARNPGHNEIHTRISLSMMLVRT